MAARINPKRSFLFVSKVLGKHLAVDPYVSLLSGAALSLLLYRELHAAWAKEYAKQSASDEQTPNISETRSSQTDVEPEYSKDGETVNPTTDVVESLLPSVLRALTTGEGAKEAYEQLMAVQLEAKQPLSFIGFAETATALGHSMYAPFRNEATYVHTTRHHIPDLTPMIQFEEEHSHAVAHRCYAQQEGMIDGTQSIVLVDDEITTGKTTLNIIRAIHEQYPRQTYYVASLLDWRSAEHVQRYAELEQELHIDIVPLSLIKGNIAVEGQAALTHPPFMLEEIDEQVPVEWIYLDHTFQQLHDHASVDGLEQVHASPFVKHTGRFGLASADNERLDDSIAAAGRRLREMRSGERTLCLGTEEFMYVPMRIGAEMGEGVRYHSTTRSPVYRTEAPDYAIHSGYVFHSAEDRSVSNYVYNIPRHGYDDVFVFLERDVRSGHLDELMDVLRTRGFRQIHVVVCGPQVEQVGGKGDVHE
ncbi:phosphoribosyltransferase family protein [Paenibacillus sp. WLX1005]|uniref:phosphoribosyltransferase family protein n=1 Tax=Paenibacillus sp. WLX1005 TaxID=3243766 RepID=UPI00398446B9